MVLQAKALRRLFHCRIAARVACCWLLAASSGLDCLPCVAFENEGDEKVRREALVHYLPNHRRMKQTLVAGSQFHRSGRAAEAVTAMQWILDQPFDVFLATPGEPLKSVKQLAEEQLRAFPQEWRDQYERNYGAEAQHLLKDAKRHQDEKMAIRVLQRFSGTAVADQTALWLAWKSLDRGEPRLAIDLLRDVQAGAQQFEKLNSLTLSLIKTAGEATADKIAAAAENELSQRSDPIAVSVLMRSNRAGRLAEQPALSDERLEADLPSVDSPFSFERLTVLRPLWRESFLGMQNSPFLLSALNTWQSHLQERNFTPVVASLPIVVRRQVVLRDYEGLRCLDLDSGQVLWKFRCESSLSTWLDAVARYDQGQFDPATKLPAQLLDAWISNNTQLNFLSSDGVRLYLVDALPAAATSRSVPTDPFSDRPDRSPENSGEFRSNETNRLLALEVPAREAGNDMKSPRVAWSLGSPPSGQPVSPESRYFFGPPAASGGRLYSLCEVDREQRLLALEAESGSILWEQPIAVADRSAVQDGGRAFVSCTPVVSGGLVLCPTQVGVLTAVDAMTGRLRWAYFDGDPGADPAGRGQNRQQIKAGERPGFAARTLVRKNRVVHLPTLSSELHCLDRETGRQLWITPRAQACSLLDVTSELVVLLEDRACRAVRLSDGSEAWRTALPALTGTGVRLGTQLVLPLEHGRLALIELSTGQNQRWYPPRAGISLGNLVNCGDMTLSIDPGGISALPQLRSARRMLTRQESTAWTTADRDFLQSQISLAEGNFDQAESSLDSVITHRENSEQLAESTGVLRELQYEKLARRPELSRAVLEKLERLSDTPSERGRWLTRKSGWLMDQRQWDELAEALRELGRLPLDAVFPASDDPDWKFSPATYCRLVLKELDQRAPEIARAYRDELLNQAESGESPKDSLQNKLFALRVCRERPEAAFLRLLWARRLIEQQRWSAAEVAMLPSATTGNGRAAVELTLQTAELYGRCGWSRDALPMLSRLEQQFGDDLPAKNQFLHEWRSRFQKTSELALWRERWKLPAGPLRSAKIHLDQEPVLSQVEGPRTKRFAADFRGFDRRGNAMSRLIPADPLSVDLFVQRSPQNSEILAIDKSSLQTVSVWPMPNRFSVPMPGGSAFQGHFFPIGLPGELRGYSLLEMAEREPVWRRRPPEIAKLNATPSIGPGGPEFVVFQIRNHLIVCDPSDGAVLWQRSDLPADSGMYADPAAGISGDESCLTVFEQDRVKYTVYDTFSGRVLRRGELENESRPPRRPFGRKLHCVWQVRGQWEARVWDPLANRWEFVEPLAERNYLAQQVIGSGELMWLTADARLKAYDVQNSRETLNATFQAEDLEGLSALRVVNDGPRTYVNIQRHSPPVQTRDYNNAFRDVPVAGLTIRDDLYAIDRETQRVLWKRTVPFRTLLKLEPAGLPFLVLLSQIRDARENNPLSLLVEVIDAETGDLIARRDKLPLDPSAPIIRHAEYDGVDQKVRVLFQRMTVEIELSPHASPFHAPTE